MSAVCLFLTLAVQAAPITGRQAAKKAMSFLYGDSKMMFSRGNVVMATADNGIQPYYVFNIGSDEGFVIVSGDDAAYPVLGYSSTGHIDLSNLPVNMQSWLDGYAAALEKIQQQNLPARREIRTASDSWQPVDMLVTSQWNQLYPYNRDCPKYKGDYQRRPTGCVATAMAQVMYYHKWPAEETAPISAYEFVDEPAWGGDGSTRKEDRLDPTVFDWDSMKDVYDYYADENSEKAVAKLMKYVGHSVKMMYGVEASGAFSEDIAPALINSFGYKNTAHIVYRADYATQREWEEEMYAELIENRPILYSGVTKDNAGHQFVCDGYENGFFHINWGWGGMSDGFFKLDVLDPYNQGTGGAGTGMAFSEYQSAVIGIMKPVEEDGIYVDDVQAVIGEETQFDIVMKNSRKNYISMQFDLRLPEGVTIPSDGVGMPKVSFNKERSEKGDHTVTISQLSDGSYRFLVYSPTNSCIKGKDGAVVRVTVKVPADKQKGLYSAGISSVIACNNRLKGYDINPCDFNFSVVGERITLGDADDNGVVDAEDIKSIMGSILYIDGASVNIKNADVDADGMLDIEDAMLALDIIHQKAGEERNIEATELNYDDELMLKPTSRGLALNLINSTLYKAVQMDVTLPSGVMITDVLPSGSRIGGFTVQYREVSPGKFRVVIYSADSSNIKYNQGMVVELVTDKLAVEAKISNIVMVTSDLRKMLLADYDYDVPAGIDDVQFGGTHKDVIHTLGGIRVTGSADKLEKGIYIVNGKKIVVR